MQSLGIIFHSLKQKITDGYNLMTHLLVCLVLIAFSQNALVEMYHRFKINSNGKKNNPVNLLIFSFIIEKLILISKLYLSKPN
jgi:hypothetical protein